MVLWEGIIVQGVEMEYGMKMKLPIDITKVPTKDLIKYEMAKELGLYDQVIEKGWGSLSARQTGKIGGMIAGERRKKKSEETESAQTEEK